MTTPAKIEPWMVEAATAIFTDVCAYETGRKDGVSVKEFAAIIAAHAPDYAAREQRLRELAITVGHGPECYADEFTRVIDHEGNAEMYTCTCGLDELRTILNREQEKP